jgi:hypothetical protein
MAARAGLIFKTVANDLQISLQALVPAPALTFVPLIAIGEQRPGGARDGPAWRLHLRVRQHA